MAAVQMVHREQLRFLRDTARSMREMAAHPTNLQRLDLLRLATEVEREADDLEVISLRYAQF